MARAVMAPAKKLAEVLIERGGEVVARVKVPPLLFLSPRMRKRARRELREMTEKHLKFAKNMKILARIMLEGVKHDNHSKR